MKIFPDSLDYRIDLLHYNLSSQHTITTHLIVKHISANYESVMLSLGNDTRRAGSLSLSMVVERHVWGTRFENCHPMHGWYKGTYGTVGAHSPRSVIQCMVGTRARIGHTVRELSSNAWLVQGHTVREVSSNTWLAQEHVWGSWGTRSENCHPMVGARARMGHTVRELPSNGWCKGTYGAHGERILSATSPIRKKKKIQVNDKRSLIERCPRKKNISNIRTKI